MELKPDWVIVCDCLVVYAELLLFLLIQINNLQIFPKEDWSYLARCVMIKTNQGVLICYEDPNGIEAPARQPFGPVPG